jgi:hypothetical protein
MKIWIMRMSCWIPKAHSFYVIVIALPLQQWLHECASVLPYTYIACPVIILQVIKSSLCFESMCP